MNKKSEKVLKYCVKKSTDDLCSPIELCAEDFKLSHSQLNSICIMLVQQGFFSDYEFPTEETMIGKAYLSYAGFCYFETTGKAKRMFIFQTAISVIALIKGFEDEIISLWKLLMQ